MEREHPDPFGGSEEYRPSPEEEAELTRMLEGKDVTPLTPELIAEQKRAAQAAREEFYRKYGKGKETPDLFPDSPKG